MVIPSLSSHIPQHHNSDSSDDYSSFQHNNPLNINHTAHTKLNIGSLPSPLPIYPIMSATLEGLPHELLLPIASFLLYPGLEVGLIRGVYKKNYATFLLDTTGLKSVQSLALTSRALCGPATEVLRECDLLTVNLHHFEPTRGKPLTMLEWDALEAAPKVATPDRQFISDEVLKKFNRLDITLPFYISRDYSRNWGGGVWGFEVEEPWRSLLLGPGTDVLMSCNMRVARSEEGEWTCQSVTVTQLPLEYGEACSSTPESIKEVIEYIEDLAPETLCEQLNSEPEGDHYYDIVPVEEAPSRLLTTHRLIRAVDFFLISIEHFDCRQIGFLTK